MFDPTEVIAEFKTPAEAHIALARLESEGIAGVITGDIPNAGSWAVLGQLQYSAIQLAVAVADVSRARDILALTPQKEELEEGWESSAESAIEGWICVSCDTIVVADQDVCPECGSDRQERPDEDEEDGEW